MVFLTYEFIAFALVAMLAHYALPWAGLRKLCLIGAGCGFLALYGGLGSLGVVWAMLMVAYVGGRFGAKAIPLAALILCLAVLAYFKYDKFVLNSFGLDAEAIPLLAPSPFVPLGISFFTFEFVHYLADRRRGEQPIAGVIDFLCFGLFWPTMVAGPIKRYEQFLPALERGMAGASLDDLARGLGRVAIGLAKKWAADNLTGWIASFEPHYAADSLTWRWVFLAALSARILLDFSGYSDMAIGFARMMGVAVPENFNWPYLARSPAAFWRRWHMSLSSWIRDYVYIPLGGNRLGPLRQLGNGLFAMALCGLWHGPDWHFVVWGVYHGVGLATGRLIERRAPAAPSPTAAVALGLLSWAGTMLFVAIGWLLFFYPLGQAVAMAGQLFWP